MPSPVPHNMPPPLPRQTQPDVNESESSDHLHGAGLLQLRPVLMNISRHSLDQYKVNRRSESQEKGFPMWEAETPTNLSPARVLRMTRIVVRY